MAIELAGSLIEDRRVTYRNSYELNQHSPLVEESVAADIGQREQIHNVQSKFEVDFRFVTREM